MDYSTYIAIFKDAFFSNLIFTLSEEIALDAVFNFGGYNYFLVSAFYIFGSTLGLFCTFLCFTTLPVIFKKYSEKSESYISFKEVLNKFYILFFALVALPLQGLSMFVPVFAGISKFSIPKFLILTLIFKAVYIAGLIIYKTKM
jgi:membrane protein YqaA with SNARE-associated domain